MRRFGRDAEAAKLAVSAAEEGDSAPLCRERMMWLTLFEGARVPLAARWCRPRSTSPRVAGGGRLRAAVRRVERFAVRSCLTLLPMRATICSTG